MGTSPTSQTTDFTNDVLGRYICNGMDEALNSMNKSGKRPDGQPQDDARPFDIIVVGGGSFGPVFAQHLFSIDKTHRHRILILEAGSLVLTEHVQNLPMLGLNPPGPTETDPGVPRAEIWGLPWRSNVKLGFPGLAYCIGGRSVFFGGWSPRPLDTTTDTEMPRNQWPGSVVDDLNHRYFDEAANQIGADVTNDFIDGPLHRALRQQLFDGITANPSLAPNAIPPAQLPLNLKLLNGTSRAMREQLKLEAPLAVQSQTSPGLFPINKFSAVPLLLKAVRAASFESMSGLSYPDDVKKRLMIVPHCRVIRLMTEVVNGAGRVTEVLTGLGSVPVPENGKVIIALGTIESTRLALLSFQGIANYNQIGKNLMAHLRSNLTIRIPRESLRSLDPAIKALQASALFVKGRRARNGRVGYFHLQITAAGLDKPGTDSEAELFKKIPDEDTLAAMRQANDNTVVITIRGIGEMQPHNPDNHISLPLDQPTDEVGVQRAFVTLAPNDDDNSLWDAMDKASDDVAKIFADGKDFEVLTGNGMVKVAANVDLSQLVPYTGVSQGGRRDGLGTTHHEAGPLWMGDDPNQSVTDANGRFHFVSNAYVAGPALFPSVGSPNPMLTGVALARRLADRLAEVPPVKADPGFKLLFDGVTTDKWRMSTIKNQPPDRSNPGTFLLVDGTLEAAPGKDLGLYYCTIPTPPDFILKLEWLRWREDDNSGVFLRFPNPNSKGYNNTAYVATDFGFEVQIDQLARSDGAPLHKTGAIYGFAGPKDPDTLPVRPVGEWNQFEIHVQGQMYTVFLNGEKITEYQNTDPNRGLPTAPNALSYIGLQTHTGRVAFRKIQIKAL